MAAAWPLLAQRHETKRRNPPAPVAANALLANFVRWGRGYDTAQKPP